MFVTLIYQKGKIIINKYKFKIMSQEKISIKNGNGQGITLSAVIYFPEGFECENESISS